MDTSRIGPEILEAIVNLLPGKATPVAYIVRLADRSLYIGTSNHTPWRLAQIVMASRGEKNTASAVIARAGGVTRLEALSVCRTEAGANELAVRWTEQARKRGEKIATDGLSEQNAEAEARELFLRDSPLQDRADF
jgi:predicted GIY-YIG superfamily endonuclease